MREFLFWFALVFILGGFWNFFKSVHYRRKLAGQAVRVVSPKRRFSSYILDVMLILFMIHRLYLHGVYLKADDITRANTELSWVILAAMFLVYNVVIFLNAKYVYITDEMILFPDCVRKAADYRYRITGNTLELLPVKPPRKTETYTITENETLLAEMLSGNYRKIED